MEDRDLESLQRHNKRLREQLTETQQLADRLLAEAQRWRKIADEERASRMKTHSALNLVVADAQRVMAENGVEGVYARLGEEREKNVKLRQQLSQRRGITQRAVAELSVARQETRDRDAVIEEMRQRLVETERQRDAAVEKAEKVIADQQAKLDRIEDQCRLWKRGELDTMTTIAGITGEFTGHPLPDAGVWDRQRALRRAEVMSMLNRATDQLHQIEARLNEQGIRLVTTHDQMVADYIDRMTGRVEAAEDRGR